jgi:hypothetical protein
MHSTSTAAGFNQTCYTGSNCTSMQRSIVRTIIIVTFTCFVGFTGDTAATVKLPRREYSLVLTECQQAWQRGLAADNSETTRYFTEPVDDCNLTPVLGVLRTAMFGRGKSNLIAPSPTHGMHQGRASSVTQHTTIRVHHDTHNPNEHPAARVWLSQPALKAKSAA